MKQKVALAPVVFQYYYEHNSLFYLALESIIKAQPNFRKLYKGFTYSDILSNLFQITCQECTLYTIQIHLPSTVTHSRVQIELQEILKLCKSSFSLFHQQNLIFLNVIKKRNVECESPSPALASEHCD